MASHLLALVLLSLAARGPELVSASSKDVEAALQPASGRARFVHLWASWCLPCVGEMPELLARLRERKASSVDIVLLSLDSPEQAEAARRILARAGGAHGRMLRADIAAAGPLIQKLDPNWDGSIPTTYLIEGDGRLALAQRGSTDFDKLWSELDRLAPRSSERQTKRRRAR